MQAAGKERGQQQVEDSRPGGVVDKYADEAELNCEVDDMDPSHRHPVDDHGSECVEEDLEGAEEGLA